MKKVLVSVAIPGFNEQESICSVIMSILRGSFTDFEIVYVDDASTDSTVEKLKAIGDSRLRIFQNPKNLGQAATLNRAIQNAQGRYIFFVDADCTVAADWIAQGVRSLSEPGVAGVEGNIYYPIRPTSIKWKVPINPFYHSFETLINRPGSDFASGNIAFKREILEVVGGFNTSEYGNAREDSDLGWRILSHGKIVHNAGMEVFHKVETWNMKSLFKNAKRYEKDVLFFRDHRFFFFQSGRILHPKLLFFPLLLWKYRKMPWQDYSLLPAWLCYVVLARFYIWKGAFRYRTFVV